MENQIKNQIKNDEVKKMNKFLRVLFIILFVAMGGAMIYQIFFPEVMGAHSGYGVAVGWQREIGFWNLAVLMILVAVNVKCDWFYLRVVLGALMVGGLGIGTNHLLAYLEGATFVNLVGAIENYVLVIGWVIGWKLQEKIETSREHERK